MKLEKLTMTYLEEQLESSQRDVGLILDDVRRNDLRAACHGMKAVIYDLSRLLTASREAIASHDRIVKARKLQPLIP